MKTACARPGRSGLGEGVPIQAKYTFSANSPQTRTSIGLITIISNQKLLALHSIVSFDLQPYPSRLGHTVSRHNQGNMLSWHRPASRATVHGL